LLPSTIRGGLLVGRLAYLDGTTVVGRALGCKREKEEKIKLNDRYTFHKKILVKLVEQSSLENHTLHEENSSKNFPSVNWRIKRIKKKLLVLSSCLIMKIYFAYFSF
jgi:hypothetical protein